MSDKSVLQCSRYHCVPRYDSAASFSRCEGTNEEVHFSRPALQNEMAPLQKSADVMEVRSENKQCEQ